MESHSKFFKINDIKFSGERREEIPAMKQHCLTKNKKRLNLTILSKLISGKHKIMKTRRRFIYYLYLTVPQGTSQSRM